jgi:hypothetical protein
MTKLRLPQKEKDKLRVSAGRARETERLLPAPCTNPATEREREREREREVHLLTPLPMAAPFMFGSPVDTPPTLCKTQPSALPNHTHRGHTLVFVGHVHDHRDVRAGIRLACQIEVIVLVLGELVVEKRYQRFVRVLCYMVLRGVTQCNIH